MPAYHVPDASVKIRITSRQHPPPTRTRVKKTCSSAVPSNGKNKNANNGWNKRRKRERQFDKNSGWKETTFSLVLEIVLERVQVLFRALVCESTFSLVLEIVLELV